MITSEQAADQIDRMYGLKNFPRGEQGAAMHKDLVKEIGKAKDLAEAEQIIDGFLEEAIPDSTPCPMAFQIRRSVLSRLDELRPDPDCKLCNGEGFPHFVRDGISYAGAKCSCWARRPAPVYRRDPETVRAMSEEISRVAAAKRMGE